MKFIKTTIIGGLVIMVPVVIVAAVVGKALEIIHWWQSQWAA